MTKTEEDALRKRVEEKTLDGTFEWFPLTMEGITACGFALECKFETGNLVAYFDTGMNGLYATVVLTNHNNNHLDRFHVSESLAKIIRNSYFNSNTYKKELQKAKEKEDRLRELQYSLMNEIMGY